MLGNDEARRRVGGLISKFQQGLGDVVASWVSTGQNPPVSADQVHQALGSDTIASIAQQLGICTATLPAIAGADAAAGDRPLTPNGQVPAGGPGDVGNPLVRRSRS